MKKILSLVLVVAMMASVLVFAPAASADSGFSVEITDAVAHKGDSVTVDLVVTGTTLRSYALVLDFDTTRLENPVMTKCSDVWTSPKPIGAYSDDYAATMTANIDGASADISGGYTLLTITFDVKAGAPAGDAYVRVPVFDDVNNIFLAPTSDYRDAVADYASIAGAVTVLPDGYVAGTPATEIPASDLEYDLNDNEDGYVISGYAGSATGGTAIIPATIEGLPVVEIGQTAFNYAEFDTYIFPASVVTFGRRAVRQDAGFEVYIAAESASFDERYYQSFVSNDGDVVVHSSASSDAKTYVEAVLDDDDTVAISWSAEEYSAPPVVTIVGETTSTYIVSAGTIEAPGAAIIAGKTFFGWKADDAFVAAGADVEITGDTTFEAVALTTPETQNGASIKAANNYAALRFTATLNVAEYDTLLELFGKENVKHGMLIAPMQLIEDAGAFTHDALKQYLDFEMTGCWKVENGEYVLSASVKNFSSKTIAMNPAFNAVAYAAITIDGVTTYVYGDCDAACARDAKSILYAALGDYADDSNEYGWINTWYSKFN